METVQFEKNVHGIKESRKPTGCYVLIVRENVEDTCTRFSENCSLVCYAQGSRWISSETCRQMFF